MISPALGPSSRKPSHSRSRSRITASALLPRPHLHHGIEGTDEMLVGRVGKITDRSTYLLFPLCTAAADAVPAPYSTLRLTPHLILRRYKGTKEQIMSDLVLQNINSHNKSHIINPQWPPHPPLLIVTSHPRCISRGLLHFH